MKQYLEILETVLTTGVKQENRTGIPTYMVPGLLFKHDLSEGFPLLTTKKVNFSQVIGELCGFLHGANSAEQFRKLGCTVWDANSKSSYWTSSKHYKEMRYLEVYQNGKQKDLEEIGYLGRIYGVQWRSWNNHVDQITNLIKSIRTDPYSRRHLVTAWNPSQLDQMALPPCHYTFQVIIEQSTNKLHLTWNQRSVDVGLGLPFNIASYAALAHALCNVTGYTPGMLIGFLADVHIYENHKPQLIEQLSRKPTTLPELEMSDLDDNLFLYDISPDHFKVLNYNPAPFIKMDMAV